MRSISRSPVSMFLGSRFCRKPRALHGSSRCGGWCSQGGSGCGQGSGGQGGSGEWHGGFSGGGHGGFSGGGQGGGAGLGGSGGLCGSGGLGRAAAGDGIPAGGCADTCRRPGECNGYTWRSPAIGFGVPAFAGCSLLGGRFWPPGWPVQLFRPFGPDEGLQRLKKGQLPVVSAHLLGQLQKALQQLRRVWLWDLLLSLLVLLR